MPDLTDRILAAVARRHYQPVKPKALARTLGVSEADYRDFRRTLKKLVSQGRLEFATSESERFLELWVLSEFHDCLQ